MGRFTCLGWAAVLCACGTELPRSAVRASSPRIDSLIAAGEAHYWSSDFDSAQTVWLGALQQSRGVADSASEAVLLTWLGLAAWRTGEYDKARELGESALALKSLTGLEHELWRSHNALAVLALSEDRLFDALEHAERAVATARQAHDSTALARANANLALANAYLGNFDRALTGFRATQTAARAHGDMRVQANALANIAMVEIWAGNPTAAVAALDSARRLYRTIDYAPGEQNAYGQLATAYELEGDYSRALVLLDSALLIARMHELQEQEMETLRLLGGVHERIGDLPRALRYLEQAAVIGRAVGLPGEVGNVLRTEAKVRLALGTIRFARALADSARRAHSEAGAIFDEIDDALVQAEIEQVAGDTVARNRRLHEARELSRRIRSHAAAAGIDLAEARFALQRNEPQRAVELLRAHMAGLEHGQFMLQSDGNALLARSYSRLGAYDSAAAAGFRAVSALERSRVDLAEPLAAQYARSRAEVYAQLVLALLHLGRDADAFAVADAARSRALLERLGAVATDGGVAGAELHEADALLRRIDQLVRQLSTIDRAAQDERSPASDMTASQLSSEIAQARADYEALMLRAGRRVPRESRLLGAAHVSVHEVQRALAPDETLLEYLIAGDDALLFVLDRSTLRAVKLPSAVALLPRIRVLRDLWGRSGNDWQAALPFAQALHQALIAPALETGMIRRGNRLLVVPHGALAQVPFAALQSPGTARFLVEDYSVTLLPSAATLPALRASASPAAGARGAVFAPFPRALPGSEAEAKAIGRTTRAVELRGRKAHEAALRRELSRAAFVHVASHGVLNAVNPMFSRVELARTRGGRASEDGRLEVHEVMGLRIATPLVFLSGCETDAAREWSSDPVRGASHTTLAQAFLFAGARDVVATLWRVNDIAASVLARRFYQHLNTRAPAAALAHAQRDLLQDSAYANPYYWASYTVHGSGDAPRAQEPQVASVRK